MKIIFLDIDGVLNSNTWYSKRATDPDFKYIGNEHHKDDMDPDTISRLNQLEGASIVISSSWRLDYTETKSDLEYNGVKLPIIGGTPFFKMTKIRGEEIKAWLDNHPDVTHYVIFDDDKDMLPEQMENFIHTPFWDGLQQEHIDKAKLILEL